MAAPASPHPSSPGPQTLRGRSQVLGHRGRSQGHCGRHKGRPVPPAFTLPPPLPALRLIVRARLCSNYLPVSGRHAASAALPDNNPRSVNPRAVGVTGEEVTRRGGHSRETRGGGEHPDTPCSPLSARGSRFNLFFSPRRPRRFSSPPIASPLCGLISLSKWHNPPGNLLVACGGEENH